MDEYLPDGYQALFVSIVSGCTSDEAMGRLGIAKFGGGKKTHEKRSYSEQDALEMIRLRKQGMIVRQVAKQFSVSRETVKRWTEKVKNTVEWGS